MVLAVIYFVCISLLAFLIYITQTTDRKTNRQSTIGDITYIVHFLFSLIFDIIPHILKRTLVRVPGVIEF